MITDTTKRLVQLLKEIDGSYKDFVIGILTIADVPEEQKALIRYIEEAENEITTNDVIMYADYMRTLRDNNEFQKELRNLEKAGSLDPITRSLYDKLYAIGNNVKVIRWIFASVDTLDRQRKLLDYLDANDGIDLEHIQKKALLIADEDREYEHYDPAKLALDYIPTDTTFKMADLISDVIAEHEVVQSVCNDVGKDESDQQALIDFIEAGIDVDPWTIIETAMRIGFKKSEMFCDDI